MKIGKHICVILMAIATAGSLASCMTLFSKSDASILVNRDTTEPLTILTADDTLQASEQLMEIRVRKKHLNRPIRFVSEENVYQELIPGRRIDAFGLLADLYLWGVGLPVDFATGKIYQPANTTYYVASAPADSCPALPVQDCRPPSPWRPREGRLYRHELRLGAAIGNRMNKASHDELYRRTCRELNLTEDPDAFYCGLGAVVNASASLAYYYHLDRRWAVGLIAGTGGQCYESLASREAAHGQQQESTTYAGDIYSTSWFFIPTVKLHWAFQPAIRFYAKCGVGAMSQHNWFDPADGFRAAQSFDERTWHWAYQLSPVGIEMGKDRLRFYCELGYGHEGVLTMGFSTFF